MKRVLIIAILTLLAISSGFADGYPAEEAEHWEKVRQLEQLADRFKAETGFTGSIQSSTERMRLSYFDGRFAGIQIAADADTASYRAAFEQILDKVLPYTFAKREQLTSSRITHNQRTIETDYYQQINGYRVEGAGRISFYYEKEYNRLEIGNGTVVLPEELLGEVISESEAYQIALDLYKQTEFYDASRYLRSRTVIAFKARTLDGVRQPYRLCWRVTLSPINYYIDAITKETWAERYVINRD